MNILKKHIVIVASGAVSLLAVVGMVLGMGGFASAQKMLDEAKMLAGKVTAAGQGVDVKTADGRSHRIIPTKELVKRAREGTKEIRDKAFETQRSALHRNIGFDPKTGKTKRQVLLEGIFPKPSGATAYGFPSSYRAAIGELLAQLKAGTPPTEHAISEELEHLDRRIGFHGDAPTKEGGRNAEEHANQFTEEGKRIYAAQQAALNQAKTIKLYADVDSLDIVPEAYEAGTGTPPDVEAMWWAQLSLWIQQDLVAAMAEINASADNVMASPVKRLFKINVQHGYYLNAVGGKSAFRGGSAQKTFAPSFTGLTATKHYDLTAFELDIVVDVRKIPLLIDAIHRQGHYLLYQWNIESVEAETQQDMRMDRIDKEQLYRYGSDPVVRFTSSWEVYLFRDFYHWGIVGYGYDEQEQPAVRLMNGALVAAPGEQREGVEGLVGLMPASIRNDLAGEDTPSRGRAGGRHRDKRGTAGRD